MPWRARCRIAFSSSSFANRLLTLTVSCASTFVRQQRPSDSAVTTFVGWDITNSESITDRSAFRRVRTVTPIGLTTGWRRGLLVISRSSKSLRLIPTFLVIPYEELCAEPQTWAALCERIGIASTGVREVRLIVRADPDPKDCALASEAQKLHARYMEHVSWLPTPNER